MSRYLLIVAAIVLVLLVTVVFHPVAGFGFLGLDDPRYVTANTRVQQGLSWENVRWAWSDTSLGFYCPVTSLSHMADCQLYALRPSGHHVTSLVLHAASAVLLMLAFWRMTRALAPSFVVAVLFAIHPLHVEPVAWIAERKELLCGFFWFAAMLAYASYAIKPSTARYGFVLLSFVLALLAKPMAVTLPFALLLLDVWPLGRWPGDLKGPGQPARLSRLLLEKIPLLIPVAAMSFVTVTAQTELGAMGSQESYPLVERIANALYACGAYVVKAIAPRNLAALYPFEHGSMPAGKLVLGVAVLAAGSAAAIVGINRRRYLTVGWLWFVGTLVPTIGLVHVGSQAMADRYTYIPLVGLFAAVAFGAAEALSKAPRAVLRIATGATGAGIVVLCVLAHAQVLTWRNDEALYRQILRVSPNSILAYYNLGNYYLTDKNDPRGAMELYERALAVDSRYGDVHFHLGLALTRLGKTAEALDHYQEAVRLKPGLLDAHLALAETLWRTGDRSGAVTAMERARDLAPSSPGVHQRLGLLYGELARWNEAASILEKATALAPSQAEAWGLLGFARLHIDDREAAARAFRQALILQPAAPQPHYYLGMMALEAGDRAGAQEELEALRALDTRLADALAAALARP